jgi:hypothetical protein
LQITISDVRTDVKTTFCDNMFVKLLAIGERCEHVGTDGKILMSLVQIFQLFLIMSSYWFNCICLLEQHSSCILAQLLLMSCPFCESNISAKQTYQTDHKMPSTGPPSTSTTIRLPAAELDTSFLYTTVVTRIQSTRCL